MDSQRQWSSVAENNAISLLEQFLQFHRSHPSVTGSPTALRASLCLSRYKRDRFVVVWVDGQQHVHRFRHDGVLLHGFPLRETTSV